MHAYSPLFPWEHSHSTNELTLGVIKWSWPEEKSSRDCLAVDPSKTEEAGKVDRSGWSEVEESTDATDDGTDATDDGIDATDDGTDDTDGATSVCRIHIQHVYTGIQVAIYFNIASYLRMKFYLHFHSPQDCSSWYPLVF